MTGGRACSSPRHVSSSRMRFVFVRFQPDAANELSPIDPLQALLLLQESGFWVEHDKQSIRAFLGWIQSTPSFTLTYSDVDQAAVIIHRLLA
jgi:hypothetical protein